MFCQHCGKEISDDSIFCEHCGGKLEMKQNRKGDGVLLSPISFWFAIISIVTFFIRIDLDGIWNNVSNYIWEVVRVFFAVFIPMSIGYVINQNMILLSKQKKIALIIIMLIIAVVISMWYKGLLTQ